jgi:Rrf2 family protein
MFSESVKHAIQAMICLAANEEKLMMVSQISDDYNIPKYYLAKLVQVLSKHHLIHSVRGRNGGIKLNKPASNIRIIDIIRAIEGPPPEHEMCLFGLDICSDAVPCPIHSEWKKMKALMDEKLVHKNLNSLVKELRKKHKMLENI